LRKKGLLPSDIPRDELSKITSQTLEELIDRELLFQESEKQGLQVEQEIVDKMQVFGRNIGMAFQILDDILDFTGEQEFVGKPVGSDLLQGLVTLPTLYYIEKYPDDKNVVTLLAGNFSTHPEAMTELVQSVRSSECIKLALKDARSLVESVINILKDMPTGEERQALEELAWYIVDRNI